MLPARMRFSIGRRYVAGRSVRTHVAALRGPSCRPGMIPLSIDEIAAIVGGTVEGDGAIAVTAPAVLDSRQAEPGGLFVAFAGEHMDGHNYAGQAGEIGAAAVLGSRPTPLTTVVVGDAEAALQALATHVVGRLRDELTVVGVTGSQGKTSTKDLLAAVLSSAASTIATIGSLNNELGVPLTMLRAAAATRFLVLEMGARHIGDIAELTALVAPDIAVVINVGQAHLGKFGSRGAIAQAKGELVQGLAQGGTAILNADDPRVMAMRSLTDGPVLTFGYAEHADVRVVDLVVDRLGRPSFTLRTTNDSVPVSLQLVGAHQALNASAATAAGLAAGVPLDMAAAALSIASLSKWRMELRDLADGARLLNDSYNANPDSTRAALDALAAIEGGRRIAVVGEMLELGDESDAAHRAIGEYAASRADIVIAVGEGAQPIAHGAGERAVALADNNAAVDWLRSHLAAGDVVLVKASRGAHLDEVAAALA
jgi:UDP-N-acetylmuramoyl-tripeptide--D-alanyl-D-alanine ligase